MNTKNNLQQKKTKIKVLGIGGGGGNTIEHILKNKMIDNRVGETKYIYLHTGKHTLNEELPYQILQIGAESTQGLGAGTNPEKGKSAVIEVQERIVEIIADTDMLFLTAGMGGGTGTGAIPVVADLAKKEGILTIAVVTKPFSWEGKKRMQVAENGINELKKHVDSLIIISNDKLSPLLGKKTSLLDAFSQVNNILLNAVDGIADLITNPGFINIDFADVKSVMSNMGLSIVGIGCASGNERAKNAFDKAILSPLLENMKITDAKGLLVNVTCGSDLSIAEYNEIGHLVKELSSIETKIIVGSVLDNTMKGELCISIVAAGVENTNISTTNKLC